jgi:transglutaminase-like putative cysteine protease
MRIKVTHETIYTYRPPARSVMQVLRLTPRSHEGQYVREWRIDVNRDCRLRAAEDPLGNITHGFALDEPVEELAIRIDGTVETHDTAGVVRHGIERFPPGLFLRGTALTRADEAIQGLASSVQVEAGGDGLATMHALTARVHELIAFVPGTTTSFPEAAQALAQGKGVCQDHAHVLLAAARRLGIPCRYVSGHLLRDAGPVLQEAAHAWVEAHLPHLGWVGFDPANGVCPTENYIRIAIGLDYLGAAPVRGTRYGGGGESLEVRVRVHDARRQSQA